MAVIAVLALLLAAVTPGERLIYDVRYGPLAVGSLALEVMGRDTIDTVECWHLRADLELVRSLSWVFWANYRLESWCRTRDFVTLRSYKRTQEPRYKATWVGQYQPENGQAVYSDGKCYPLADSARDVLTLWYYFRNRKIAVGETLVAAVHDSRRNYLLTAVVSSVRRVTVPAGIFDCIAVNPRAGTPLGSVYVSTDDERLPVVIRTRFGGLIVSALLRRVEVREG